MILIARWMNRRGNRQRINKMSNTNTGFDASYSQGVKDALSGVPSSPPAAAPHVQEAYRIGRETATKGGKQ
jgi:hypothetical protein